MGATSVIVPPIEEMAGPDAIKSTAVDLMGSGALADLRVVGEPPLEGERVVAERASKGKGAVPDLHIETGFECATNFGIRQVSPTHFALTMVPPRDDERMPLIKDWFMFRVTGAKARTIRFDIIREFSPDNWHPLNPVFAYAAEPADARLYPAPLAPPEDARPSTIEAYNSVRHPVGGSGLWQWVDQTWQADDDTFSFVQNFVEDRALVALRFPRPPSYNERFFASLAGNPLIKVVEVGRSGEGRPLLMAQVGQSNLHTKPCVLVYGGEHADEQDSMWVAQGVLERLLTDDPKTKRLRDRLTFLVIPTMDPDGAAAGVHDRIVESFITPGETVESVAYANWFKRWVGAGNRIDVVLDFHNIQARGAHVSLVLMESLGERGRISRVIGGVVANEVRRAGFTALDRPEAGWSPDRLGGWLSRRYGPLTLSYEINSQSGDTHLSIDGMRRLGAVFAEAQLEFFESSAVDVSRLLANIDARRAEDLARWAQHGPIPPGLNAIQAEAVVSKGVGLRKRSGDELMIENWIP